MKHLSLSLTPEFLFLYKHVNQMQNAVLGIDPIELRYRNRQLELWSDAYGFAQ